MYKRFYDTRKHLHIYNRKVRKKDPPSWGLSTSNIKEIVEIVINFFFLDKNNQQEEPLFQKLTSLS